MTRFENDRKGRALLGACGFGLAIALSTAACGDRHTATRTNEQPPAATASDAGSARNSAQAPVTVTGCLQKGDGRSFILTEINSPRTSVGTSGSASSTTAVEREQMRAAAHAYRLQSDDDKNLDALVGHQVRVQGTVTERADLPQAQSGQGGAGQAQADRSGASGARKTDAGSASSRMDRQTKIDESDLAKIDVASIEGIADACGGGSSKR